MTQYSWPAIALARACGGPARIPFVLGDEHGPGARLGGDTRISPALARMARRLRSVLGRGGRRPAQARAHACQRDAARRAASADPCAPARGRADRGLARRTLSAARSPRRRARHDRAGREPVLGGVDAGCPLQRLRGRRVGPANPSVDRAPVRHQAHRPRPARQPDRRRRARGAVAARGGHSRRLGRGRSRARGRWPGW